MPAAQTPPYVTPEEYLALEREATVKHEYLRGVIRPLHRDENGDGAVAMAGASPAHVLLVTNLVAALHGRLRARGCLVFSSDLRVRIETQDLFTYPDLSVVCGEPSYEEQALTNPLLIVEVLSASTERYDRGKKFAMYRSLPSLREYMLVSQQERHVEVFRKSDTDRWELFEFDEGEIELASVGTRIALDEVYLDVDLPEHPPLRG